MLTSKDEDEEEKGFHIWDPGDTDNPNEWKTQKSRKRKKKDKRTEIKIDDKTQSSDVEPKNQKSLPTDAINTSLLGLSTWTNSEHDSSILRIDEKVNKFDVENISIIQTSPIIQDISNLLQESFHEDDINSHSLQNSISLLMDDNVTRQNLTEIKTMT